MVPRPRAAAEGLVTRCRTKRDRGRHEADGARDRGGPPGDRCRRRRVDPSPFLRVGTPARRRACSGSQPNRCSRATSPEGAEPVDSPTRNAPTGPSGCAGREGRAAAGTERRSGFRTDATSVASAAFSASFAAAAVPAASAASASAASAASASAASAASASAASAASASAVFNADDYATGPRLWRHQARSHRPSRARWLQQALS